MYPRLRPPFKRPTYIVLDIPPPFCDEIGKIRQAMKDDFHADLPVDVTLAGSGGLGAVAQNQDPKILFETLDEIASRFKPITTRFRRPFRFPNTHIVVLPTAHKAPFEQLQRRLRDSGIQFKKSKFPFLPHTTLRSTTPISQEEWQRLSKFRLAGSFTLHKLSVYRLGKPVELLHRVKLSNLDAVK